MSFDDLLGTQPVKRGPGRPRLDGLPSGQKPIQREKVPDETVSLRTTDVHHVVGGVSVPWLMRVFRMGRGKVEDALKGCKPVSTAHNGGLLYDLAEASSYLVRPKKDFDAFLKTITVEQLPDHMKDGFWSAKLKEQKWKLLAGDLWPTVLVMEVLGDTFKNIRSTTQLWADTVQQSAALSDKQRNVLMELVDGLLDELHKSLVGQANRKATASQIAELDDV